MADLHLGQDGRLQYDEQILNLPSGQPPKDTSRDRDR